MCSNRRDARRAASDVYYLRPKEAIRPDRRLGLGQVPEDEGSFASG